MDDRIYRGLHLNYDFKDGLHPCNKPWDYHDNHIHHSLHPFYDPGDPNASYPSSWLRARG